MNSAINMRTVCNYASEAPSQYKCPPDFSQIAAGVVPLDTLPAAWWNWMWNDTNAAVNEAKVAIQDIFDEVKCAIECAGYTTCCLCSNQLASAIDTLTQRVGTSSKAGAVKSSSTCGEVSIDPTTGVMTANGVGNAANLNTTNKVIVPAINELKDTYDCCITDIGTCLTNVGTCLTNVGTCLTNVGTCLGDLDTRITDIECAGGVSINVYCGTTCKCSISSTSALCLGSNAFNSTVFTTCKGTVTAVCVYCNGTCKCSITTSGAICLGTNAFNSTAFTTCTGNMITCNRNLGSNVHTAVIDVDDYGRCERLYVYTAANGYLTSICIRNSLVCDAAIHIVGTARCGSCASGVMTTINQVFSLRGTCTCCIGFNGNQYGFHALIDFIAP